MVGLLIYQHVHLRLPKKTEIAETANNKTIKPACIHGMAQYACYPAAKIRFFSHFLEFL